MTNVKCRLAEGYTGTGTIRNPLAGSGQ